MIENVGCEYDQNKDYTVKYTMQDLNNYLVVQTGSRDPKKNFKLVGKLYGKHLKDKKIDKKLLEADELFLALSGINDENICTPYSNSIILNMSNNLGGAVGNINFSTRIGAIFEIYLNKWMQTCGSSYPKVLREKLATMDQVKLNYLDIFFDEAIQHYETREDVYSQGKSAAFRLMNIANAFTYCAEVRQSDYILRKLQEIAEADPSAKSEEEKTIFFNDERQGKKVFKESKFYQYYVEPCRYYGSQLGNSVFEPAFLGYKVSGRKLLNEDDLLFYRAWAKYKLCTRNYDLSAHYLSDYALKGHPREAGYIN